MTPRMGRELVSNGVPRLDIDQRRMLSGVELAFVSDLTDVNRVREQPVDVPAREGHPAALAAARCGAPLCLEPESVGLLLDPAHATKLPIKGEDTAYNLGLGRVDDQRALARVVAERHVAAHPHPLLL